MTFHLLQIVIKHTLGQLETIQAFSLPTKLLSRMVLLFFFIPIIGACLMQQEVYFRNETAESTAWEFSF